MIMLEIRPKLPVVMLFRIRVAKDVSQGHCLTQPKVRPYKKT
jgi:hypothetical protein